MVIKSDLKGQKFGRLTAVAFSFRDKSGYSIWFFHCECGNYKLIRGSGVKNGHAKSCGCLNKEKPSNLKHGLSKTPLYSTWEGIKERCYNKKSKSFKNYGMRGISMKNQWVDDPESFIKYVLEYLGEKPTKNHSLDRINNDGNYEPGNLRWATRKEQQNNMRSNIVLEFNGEKHNVSQWAEIKGMKRPLIRSRILSGWSIEKTLTTPANN